MIRFVQWIKKFWIKKTLEESIISNFRKLPTLRKKDIFKELEYITFYSKESWEDYKFKEKDYRDFNNNFYSLSEIYTSQKVDDNYIYNYFDKNKYSLSWVFINTKTKEYYFGKENKIVILSYVLEDTKTIQESIRYLEKKYNEFDFRLLGVWRELKKEK